MQTSPSISNLTKALLRAQQKMGSAVKGNKNPFFKSNYADLPTVMEVVKGPLNEEGIVVLQPAAFRDGKNFIQTVLIHGETGEALVSETEVICAKQNDPQAFGAAQTYARRFSLQAMLFIPAEDDDGNYASNRTTTQPKVGVALLNSKETTAVSAAATTPTVATTVAPAQASSTVAEIQPLKSTSFRKPKATTVAATPAPVAAPQTDDGWNS
jgi:hypothetical protein